VIALLLSVGLVPAQDPPNVVLFLVDDMGWQDTSVPFHSEVTPFNRRYRTPAMERMAREGMKFTQAYVSAICSPTRVSLMTGLNAATHRVTNWTLRKDANNDHSHPRLASPAWHVNGLSPEAEIPRTVHARALPSFLAEAGYHSIPVGKAHFGAIDTPGAEPLNLGFDVNIAGHAAGAPASYYGSHGFSQAGKQGKAEGSSVWDVPGLEAWHGKDVHLTEALTVEACREVRKAVDAGKPFFLYLAHYAVHAPLMKDSRFAENYGDLDPRETAYASMIEGMDKSLGDVLDLLDELEASEDTLVLFLSDNGGLTSYARGGEPFTHNLPLSSGKGSAHEGGIRVPMLARWTGVVEPGSVCPTPVIVEDFLPTLMEVAGAPIPDQAEGVPFTPLLRGEAMDTSERAFLWHQPNTWTNIIARKGLGPHSTLLRGDWKVVSYHDPGRDPRWELFNLKDDIGERNNLAGSLPDRLAGMAGILTRELKKRNAQRSVDKATGEPIPWPDETLPSVDGVPSKNG